MSSWQFIIGTLAVCFWIIYVTKLKVIKDKFKMISYPLFLTIIGIRYEHFWKFIESLPKEHQIGWLFIAISGCAFFSCLYYKILKTNTVK